MSWHPHHRKLSWLGVIDCGNHMDRGHANSRPTGHGQYDYGQYSVLDVLLVLKVLIGRYENFKSI